MLVYHIRFMLCILQQEVNTFLPSLVKGYGCTRPSDHITWRIHMNRTIAVGLATIYFALLLGLGNVHAEDRYGKQKVVYHINYPGGEGDKAYMGQCAISRTTSMPSAPRI